MGDSLSKPLDETKIPNEKDRPAEGEEKGECGFCMYMKGGECKDVFTAWDMCLQQGEKNKGEDIATMCYQETFNLIKCMQAHRDYYAPPFLPGGKAEKAMQLEEEKKDSGDHNN